MPSHPVFAAIYDRLLAANEKAGLAAMREELLASASGRTLEIGGGTGANLDFYPAGVTELVVTEPDPHMAKRLRARISERQTADAAPAVVESPAERLPFEDSAFDTVVSTLVFCTVADPERAVAEAKRVLKPGGRLLFIEHVRAGAGSRRARWQDRLEGPWGWFTGGCHPNRDTGALLEREFSTVEETAGEFPGSGTALIKPIVRGTATR